MTKRRKRQNPLRSSVLVPLLAIGWYHQFSISQAETGIIPSLRGTRIDIDYPIRVAFHQNHHGRCISFDPFKFVVTVEEPHRVTQQDLKWLIGRIVQPKTVVEDTVAPLFLETDTSWVIKRELGHRVLGAFDCSFGESDTWLVRPGDRLELEVWGAWVFLSEGGTVPRRRLTQNVQEVLSCVCKEATNRRLFIAGRRIPARLHGNTSPSVVPFDAPMHYALAIMICANELVQDQERRASSGERFMGSVFDGAHQDQWGVEEGSRPRPTWGRLLEGGDALRGMGFSELQRPLAVEATMHLLTQYSDYEQERGEMAAPQRISEAGSRPERGEDIPPPPEEVRPVAPAAELSPRGSVVVRDPYAPSNGVPVVSSHAHEPFALPDPHEIEPSNPYAIIDNVPGSSLASRPLNSRGQPDEPPTFQYSDGVSRRQQGLPVGGMIFHNGWQGEIVVLAGAYGLFAWPADMPRPDSQFGVSDGPAFNVPDYTGIDDFDVEMAEMMSPEQLSEQAAIFSAAHAQRRPY